MNRWLDKIGIAGLCMVGSSCCSWSYPIADDSSSGSLSHSVQRKTPLEEILDSVYCIRVTGIDATGEKFVGYGSGFGLSHVSSGTLVTTSAHVISVPVGSTGVAYSIVENRADTNTADDVFLRLVAVDAQHDTSVLLAPGILSVAEQLRVGVENTFHVGDEAYIVGYPLGIDRWVTKGIVSDIYSDSYILDINVNFGNSGGLAITPLKDGSFALIGQVKACLASEYVPTCKEFGVIQGVHTLVPFWEKYIRMDQTTHSI